MAREDEDALTGPGAGPDPWENRGQLGLAPGLIAARGDGRDRPPSPASRSPDSSRARSISTNPIEPMVERVQLTARNVNRRQSGEMALRGTATVMIEAEHRFHRIIGGRRLAALPLASVREPTSSRMTEEVATLISA